MTEKLEKSVESLIAEGEGLFDDGQYEAALVRFHAAWDALPDPRDDHVDSVTLLAAIADVQFRLGNWEGCRSAIQHAFFCGGDMDDVFLQLRLGQALFELGDEEASDWLVPVYLHEGLAPFADEDPKYLASFRDKLEPPVDGWPKGW